MNPESRFINGVNGKIPSAVHREKMHNIYRGGTFDVWYSGSKADWWIEYKWIPRIPKKGRVVPNLSPLQLRWGVGRYEEGRNVAVVVGCPEGVVMLRYPDQWEEGVSVEEFRRTLLTKATLAEWITLLTAGDPKDAGSKEAARHGAGNRRPIQDSHSRSTDLGVGEVPHVEAPHHGIGGD